MILFGIPTGTVDLIFNLGGILGIVGGTGIHGSVGILGTAGDILMDIQHIPLMDMVGVGTISGFRIITISPTHPIIIKSVLFVTMAHVALD